MSERPYVVLSCAISLDGCLDGVGEARLVLSGAADLDRVDAERAAADAIMVGAGTIRRDDPRLLIRSAQRRADRAARGQPEHPAGVTITRSGDLDPAARFFTRGRCSGEPAGGGPAAGRGAVADSGAVAHGGAVADGVAAGGDVARDGAWPKRLVYGASPVMPALRARLGGLAEIADAGDPPRLGAVLADLARRGVGHLMVEGGAQLGTEFLTGGLVDELQLVIAPFFVGDPAAPRFAGPGTYPAGPGSQLNLTEVRQVGEVVLLRYRSGRVAALNGAPGQSSEVHDG
jgi:5-amino-6-(5-phosphoribosylamino)uracil reductase